MQNDWVSLWEAAIPEKVDYSIGRDLGISGEIVI